jgi:hypothetical protein
MHASTLTQAGVLYNLIDMHRTTRDAEPSASKYSKDTQEHLCNKIGDQVRGS